MTGGNRGFFVVMLPTLECNMDCSYCYSHKPAGRWTREQTRHVLDEVFSLAREERFSHLRLHWQGGEPLLMGPEYWEWALGLAGSMAKDTGIEIDQVMQTNLTLYDGRMAPLVKQHLGGRLGTSFESAGGRRFKGGDRDGFVERWSTALAAARDDGLEIGVLALLDPETAGRDAGEVLAGLGERHGVRGVRITLPFRTSEGRGYWIDPVQAGRFLVGTWKWWERMGGDRHMHVKPFSYLRARLSGEDPQEHGLCFFASNCAHVGMSVTPLGDVTLCDNFATDPAYAPWGNVFEEPLANIVAGAGRSSMQAAVRDLVSDECLECRDLALCHGGCLARSPDGSRFHYCVSYRMLFDAIRESVGRG
jgi:uncharacterized protein